MKKIFLCISLVLALWSTHIFNAMAQAPAAPSPPPAGQVQDAADAVGEAGRSTAENLSAPPQPSDIYTGNFFNRSTDSRYTLQGVVDTLLPGVARWIAGFLAALGVIFLIYAGIQFLTAGGEEEKISEAIKTAVYVVAGLLLTMFAYALVYLFLTLFSP